jgi:hypothetical protein
LGFIGIGHIDRSCNSPQPRNASLGVVLVDRLGVAMPIVRAIDQSLNHSVDLDRTIANMRAMPFGVETVVLPMLRRGFPVAPPPLDPS